MHLYIRLAAFLQVFGSPAFVGVPIVRKRLISSQPTNLSGDLLALLMCRKTNDVEREIALAEQFPPVGD
jgi:hypothetical protein